MAFFAPETPLAEVISSAFRGKGKKAAAEADKLKNWFLNYYNGSGDNNILQTPLADLLRDVSSFSYAIEAGLRSFSNDKQVLAERLFTFMQYLKKEKPDFNPDLDFLHNYMCRSQEERLIRILKYLHTGSKTRAEIAENFGISERTLSGDLKILQDGFEFLGFEMKIRELERSSNTYTSVIHPLFLAMRTDEIFSLTVGLKLLSKGTIFEESLGHIADLIYKQLSPYAQETIDRHSDANKISYTDSEMRFANSYEMMTRESHKLLPYYLKEPMPCEVEYNDAGNKKKVVGILSFYDGSDDRWQKVIVKNPEGETVIGIRDVIIIEKAE